jgi:acyl-CoA thioester hydrolase
MALREVCRLRVRYGETDQMRFAYHGHAAVWFDQARTELLRLSGHCYRDLEEQGLWLPVLSLHVDYHRAATYDDELVVKAAFRPVLKGGAPSDIQFDIIYEALVCEKLCYTGYTRHCFMEKGPARNRAIRLPRQLRPLLQGSLQGEDHA